MNATAFGTSAGGATDTAPIEPLDVAAPEDRGGLRLDDRVVEKIAGYAVTSVPDAAAAPRRVLGVNIGEARPEDAASVQAHVQDDIASVQAQIAVRWPVPVQGVADEVRRRIRSEVEAMTGVRVDHVDVEVASWSLPERAERRVT